MKSATTLADAAGLTKGDIFDLEGVYVESLRTRPRDDRQGHFHPSAVGSCGRRNVYEYIRTPAIQTIEPEDLEVFDMGHAVHAMLQAKMGELSKTLSPKKMGYEFSSELGRPANDVLYDDFHIGGTTDGLIEIWADDWRQRGILEIKSIKDKNFIKLRGPKEDHVMQCHIYAYRFDCPVMWIWYFNKNNSERKVYPIVYDQAILDAALAKYSAWIMHAEAGTLPDREESFWSCPRCEYRDACKPPSLTKLRNKGVQPSSTDLRRIVIGG